MEKEKNIFKRVGAYLREVRGEMKKVTWPSKNDMIKTTIAVIVISLFFGIYLFGVDFIFSHIFRQIGSIFQ
ncbi:MAG: preprotein translocase subunit SecE [Candidatus Aminicenantes bacterium]|nr:preprotein translocase subunit SecE [Acidobacteriota bacterium]MCG2810014.1 preprotein translocase subunit SecE [Candidatus Aminicenantes bacterium]